MQVDIEINRSKKYFINYKYTNRIAKIKYFLNSSNCITSIDSKRLFRIYIYIFFNI